MGNLEESKKQSQNSKKQGEIKTNQEFHETKE